MMFCHPELQPFFLGIAHLTPNVACFRKSILICVIVQQVSCQEIAFNIKLSKHEFMLGLRIIQAFLTKESLHFLNTFYMHGHAP